MSDKITERRLIFIHGHGFKPPAEEFREFTLDALRSRLSVDRADQLQDFDGIQKEFVYFGDLTNEFLLSSGLEYNPDKDIAACLNTLENLKTITKPKMFSLANYDRLPGKSALREFAADLGSPLLRTLGLSRHVISRLSPDLAEYWADNSRYGKAVFERVYTSLKEAVSNKQDIFLVAHGVGSIYAYDALLALSHNPPVDSPRKIHTWLTLGSPLSDGMIRARLGARESGFKHPDNLERWFNLAAEDDYLCHDKTIKDDFHAMLDLGQIKQIRDYRIYNLAVYEGKSQPQSVLGYLAHPRTAGLVADWLASNRGSS